MAAAIVLIGLVACSSMFVSCLRAHDPFFNLMFPPEGLYAPLASCEFEFGAEGKTYELPFTPRYPGVVGLDVVVSKPQSNLVGYGGQYLLDVSILDAHGNAVLQRRIAKPDGGNFYGGPDNSGMTLVYFRVPDAIPLRQPATARVTVIAADASLVGDYGPYKLVVRKGSDE
jgi:hypothetical protein